MKELKEQIRKILHRENEPERVINKILALFEKEIADRRYGYPPCLKCADKRHLELQLAKTRKSFKLIVKHETKCDDSCGYATDIATSTLKEIGA